MLAILHDVQNDNENSSNIDYGRKHLSFRPIMLVVALIAIGMVIFAFQLFSNPPPGSKLLIRYGNVAISSHGLIAHVKFNHVNALWIGPIAGEQYSINHMQPGIVQVFYTPKGSDLSLLSTFDYKITVYKSSTIYAESVVPLHERTNQKSIAVGNEINVQVDGTNMKSEKIFFNNQPMIVTINYSQVQSMATLIHNAKRLRSVN